MRKVLEEEAASMFTNGVTEPPQDESINMLSTVGDELSPHPIHQQSDPQPTMDLWNDHVIPINPNNSMTMQQVEMTIEQLLVATADYDNATGLAKSVDHWSDTTALANMMVDDDLMSMWGAAPSFG
jgi:hypothetical protein